MPAGIRRVGVDDIRRLRLRKRIPEIRDPECPIVNRDDLSRAADLISYLGDISRSKAVLFMAVRHIKFTLAIESHHTIKAGAVEKQKIERRRFFVKPLPNCIIVILTALAEFFTLFGEEAFRD